MFSIQEWVVLHHFMLYFKNIYLHCVILLKDSGNPGKPQLDGHDLRALRRHMRNPHATMIEIKTWAQKYPGKSFSLNTVPWCIQNCNPKLYDTERKWYINTAEFSGNELISEGQNDSRQMFCGQISQYISCLLERLTFTNTCQKWERPTRLLSKKGVSCVWW